MGVLQSLLITPSYYTSRDCAQNLGAILDSHQVHYAMYRCDDMSLAEDFALQCKKRDIRVVLNATFDNANPLAILDSHLLRHFDGIHLKGAYFTCIDSIARHYGGIIGFSAHSVDEVYGALRSGAHYCTLSPIFPTPNKPAPLGIQSLHALHIQAREKTFALGGIVSDSHIAKITSIEHIKGFGSIRYFFS